MSSIEPTSQTSVQKLASLKAVAEALLEVACSQEDLPTSIRVMAAFAGPQIETAFSDLEQLDPADVDDALDASIALLARFRSDNAGSIVINGVGTYHADTYFDDAGGASWSEIRGSRIPDWATRLGEIDGGEGLGALSALGIAGPAD